MASLNRVHTAEDPSAAPAAPATGALDEAFLGEGRTLLDRACTGDQRERGQTAVMTDDLMDRARRALGEGALTAPSFARVLRASALVRNMARLPELPPDPLVHDLVAHTVQHGLAAHNAAAQALRGTLAISRGLVDEALDAAVDAMATVELLDEHTVERALAMSDTAALLDQLGLAEMSADMYGRASAEFGRIGNRGYQIMITGDQVRTEVLHGMWLERLGQAEAGAERFAGAARIAREGMALWQQADGIPELDEDFAANFHAAAALAAGADATPEHEEALRKVTSRIALPGQIVAGLALVRMLAATGRRAEAETALAELRAACQRFQLGQPLRLALAHGVLDLPRDGSSVVTYLGQIEDELWVMRSARTRALHTRLEHERLRRGSSTLRALTARDPVTNLPDRTVLDGLLDAALARAAEEPVALAMVDVDDLVLINEQGSFADGDATLRAVAVTVHAAIGPEDSLIRYSSDDFVVLLPGRTLEQAAELMRGVVAAVTRLPHDRGHGATISVGVVAADPAEGGESALVRADDATAQAKADGGNQVAAVPATPAPRG